MGLHTLLELTHVLGRGVHTRHEGVAGDAILLILSCHILAHRIRGLQLLALLKLGHILTHVGEGNGGDAGEHAAGIIVKECLNAGRTSRMPLKQARHIIHRPFDHNPVLIGTLLHGIQRVHGTFLTEQHGDEPEDSHE